jgi:hypothetical protein
MTKDLNFKNTFILNVKLLAGEKKATVKEEIVGPKTFEVE